MHDHENHEKTRLSVSVPRSLVRAIRNESDKERRKIRRLRYSNNIDVLKMPTIKVEK